jgi:hypothetical protein
MTRLFNDEGRRRAVYEALTRYNYFPNQRSTISEIPPSLNSRQFTPEVADELAAIEDSKLRKKAGYDLVEYKATRYNNVPRLLGLVHPKAHAFLARCIHDNWSELEYLTENANSMIKPTFYHEDRRLMVMNYDDPIKSSMRNHSMGFGKRFRVNSDISNCFSSIYSHAIPWAAVGITEAKAHRDANERWFNQLDMFQRKTKRNETQGIPVGPATSSIVTEIILGCIDTELTAKGYEYYRYIDDYTCYCVSDIQANEFIKDLTIQLGKYKLSLNLHKTEIVSLPSSDEDSWVLELHSSLPTRLNNAHPEEPKITTIEALTFLNRALEINKRTPDGSVLKYAISLILNHLDKATSHNLLVPLINLSWHFPVLLPLLDSLATKGGYDLSFYQAELCELIRHNAVLGRSDGMAWPLHSLLKASIEVDDETAEKVIESKDCVSLTLLLEMNGHQQKIVNFATNIVSSDDLYEKDVYWLLLYQLFYKDLIPPAYDDDVFACLKRNQVNFVPGDSKSAAEERADEIAQDIEHRAIGELFGRVDPPSQIEPNLPEH